MKTTFLSVALALLATLGIVAQPNSIVPKNIRAANTLDNLFDGNGLTNTDNLWGIPLEPGRVTGTTYLTEGWCRTTIMLYDVEKLIEGYPTRYELDLDQIEIKTSSDVKVLNGRKVKSFVWIEENSQLPHYFVNARDYQLEDGSRSTGFYEVLSDGPVTLLSKTSILVKEPTYNVALDMGNRDTRLVKKTEFYYADGEILKTLPSSKKKLVPVFGEHAEAAGEFIKSNKLSLTDAVHLKALFDHCNDAIATN